MTTSAATEVTRRRRQAPTTIRQYIDRELCAAHDELRRPEWPSPRWRDDPVGFATEALGVKPWSRQREILEAVRDHKRVAVASGHKVSKSHTAAILALWFFCSFPDSRVILSSTTSRQVDQILWRELRMIAARATVVVNKEPPMELARSGMKSDDFREIVGFTAREAEAVAGISGANLLYIIDEASGVPQVIFDAIEGNRAGGARLVMFSNPTRIEGEFFEAFHGKSRFYKTLQISSEESPNIAAGREVVPGLATLAWIEEKREEWGEDSPLYRVRVKGQFVTNEAGRVIALDLIAKSEAAWSTASDEGPLHIGVDPAGDGGKGDESAFAVRRGNRLLALHAKRGLSEEAHALEVLGLVHEHGMPREKAIVKIDTDGVGYNVSLRLRPLADKELITLVGVKGSTKLARPPYERVRDAVWAGLRDWMKAGGGILEDVKLAKELHCPEWITHPITKRDRVIPKEEMRKHLGRSPDRADAVALAVWEPSWLALEEGEETATTVDGGDPYREPSSRGLDPYDALDAWRSRS